VLIDKAHSVKRTEVVAETEYRLIFPHQYNIIVSDDKCIALWHVRVRDNSEKQRKQRKIAGNSQRGRCFSAHDAA